MGLKDIKLTQRERIFLKEKDEKKAYKMVIRKNASTIRQEVLVEKFEELKNEQWICYAGEDWNLPANTLIEKFKELKNEMWICYAGKHWNEIPVSLLIEKFKELKDEMWTYYAGIDWKGLPENILMAKFKEFKDERVFKFAEDAWNLNEYKYNKIINMFENAEITKEFANRICNNTYGWYKSDMSLDLRLLLDALRDNVFDLEQKYTRKEIEMLLLGYNSNKNNKNIELGF